MWHVTNGAADSALPRYQRAHEVRAQKTERTGFAFHQPLQVTSEEFSRRQRCPSGGAASAMDAAGVVQNSVGSFLSDAHSGQVAPNSNGESGPDLSHSSAGHSPVRRDFWHY